MKPTTKPEDTTQAARKLPLLMPDMFTIDSEGQFSRHIVVRLPKGAILDDLKEPALWAPIQRNRDLSLRKFDRLCIIAADESWLCDCIVTGADDHGASLSTPKKTDLKAQIETLFENATHAIRWVGSGWQTVRKQDAVPVTAVAMTPELARKDFDNLSPRPMAA